MEVLVVKTITLRDVEGQFMYEREYIAFGETWAGGRLSEEKAKQNWLKWKEASVDPNVKFPPFDNDGPEHSPHRLWVKTATKLNFQQAHETQKQFKMEEKNKKEMNKFEIDAAHKRLLQDHDSCAGGNSLTPDLVAQHMANHGHGGGSASGAFQGRMVDCGDVTLLVPSEGEDEEEDAEEDAENEEEDAGVFEDAQSRGSNPPGKKVPWFDVDKAVAAFTRGDANQIDTLMTSVKKTVKEMTELLNQVDSDKYSALKPLMNTEYTLCEKRRNFLNLVLSEADTADDDLKQAISVVKAEQELLSDSGSMKGKGGKGGKGSVKTTGRSPPSSTYEKVFRIKMLTFKMLYFVLLC